MSYWLMKSEPDVYSFDDLKQAKTDYWEGVRNYQARNMLRDQMQVSDQAFFYHSNCKQPGIVGIMEIIKSGYPDFTAYDPKHKYFDAKSDPEQPRWYMVDVKYVRHLERPIFLDELKANPKLINLPLVRRGNRLSIMPISEIDWQSILELESN